MKVLDLEHVDCLPMFVEFHEQGDGSYSANFRGTAHWSAHHPSKLAALTDLMQYATFNLHVLNSGESSECPLFHAYDWSSDDFKVKGRETTNRLNKRFEEARNASN